MKYFVVIFFGTILLLIILVGFFIFRVFKKSTEKKSVEFIEEEQGAMFEKVQKMKGSLEAWSLRTSEDLTTSMNYKYKKGMANHLTGKIMSKDGKAVVAFDRLERGLKSDGYMFASSTDFDIFYDLRDNEFTITYNSRILGDIDQTGAILNADGTTIGHALHPIKMSLNIAGIRSRKGERSFPCEMNGRLLATIQVAPNHQDKAAAQSAVKSNENKYGQQVLELHDTPTVEEEKWLTSLAIMETAFHGHWLI